MKNNYFFLLFIAACTITSGCFLFGGNDASFNHRMELKYPNILVRDSVLYSGIENEQLQKRYKEEFEMLEKRVRKQKQESEFLEQRKKTYQEEYNAFLEEEKVRTIKSNRNKKVF